VSAASIAASLHLPSWAVAPALLGFAALAESDSAAAGTADASTPLPLSVFAAFASAVAADAAAESASAAGSLWLRLLYRYGQMLTASAAGTEGNAATLSASTSAEILAVALAVAAYARRCRPLPVSAPLADIDAASALLCGPDLSVCVRDTSTGHASERLAAVLFGRMHRRAKDQLSGAGGFDSPVAFEAALAVALGGEHAEAQAAGSAGTLLLAQTFVLDLGVPASPSLQRAAVQWASPVASTAPAEETDLNTQTVHLRYVVSADWVRHWLQYTQPSQDPRPPAPEKLDLRPALVFYRDLIFLHRKEKERERRQKAAGSGAAVGLASSVAGASSVGRPLSAAATPAGTRPAPLTFARPGSNAASLASGAASPSAPSAAATAPRVFLPILRGGLSRSTRLERLLASCSSPSAASVKNEESGGELVLVSPVVWHAFELWYGRDASSPAIVRWVAAAGDCAFLYPTWALAFQLRPTQATKAGTSVVAPALSWIFGSSTGTGGAGAAAATAPTPAVINAPSNSAAGTTGEPATWSSDGLSIAASAVLLDQLDAVSNPDLQYLIQEQFSSSALLGDEDVEDWPRVPSPPPVFFFSQTSTPAELLQKLSRSKESLLSPLASLRLWGAVPRGATAALEPAQLTAAAASLPPAPYLPLFGREAAEASPVPRECAPLSSLRVALPVAPFELVGPAVPGALDESGYVFVLDAKEAAGGWRSEDIPELSRYLAATVLAGARQTAEAGRKPVISMGSSTEGLGATASTASPLQTHQRSSLSAFLPHATGPDSLQTWTPLSSSSSSSSLSHLGNADPSNSGMGNRNMYQGARTFMESEALVKDRPRAPLRYPPAVAGMSNIGNSCYLGSSLACLLALPFLQQYFLSREWERELNVSAPLGSGGIVAAAFADLYKSVWETGLSHQQQVAHSAQDTTVVKGAKKAARAETSDLSRAPSRYAPVAPGTVSIAPRRLKAALAQANSTFEGNDQHDSHEALVALISFLHEDLNRIRKKPYIENKDSEGRPDAIVAEEWWLAHTKREQSIISTLFTGQYRSTLTCKHCRYTSSRFETFTALALPLPEKKARYFTVTAMLPGGISPPIVFTLKIPNLVTRRATGGISMGGERMQSVIRDLKSSLVENLAGYIDRINPHKWHTLTAQITGKEGDSLGVWLAEGGLSAITEDNIALVACVPHAACIDNGDGTKSARVADPADAVFRDDTLLSVFKENVAYTFVAYVEPSALWLDEYRKSLSIAVGMEVQALQDGVQPLSARVTRMGMHTVKKGRGAVVSRFADLELLPSGKHVENVALSSIVPPAGTQSTCTLFLSSFVDLQSAENVVGFRKGISPSESAANGLLATAATHLALIPSPPGGAVDTSSISADSSASSSSSTSSSSSGCSAGFFPWDGTTGAFSGDAMDAQVRPVGIGSLGGQYGPALIGPIPVMPDSVSTPADTTRSDAVAGKTSLGHTRTVAVFGSPLFLRPLQGDSGSSLYRQVAAATSLGMRTRSPTSATPEPAADPIPGASKRTAQELVRQCKAEYGFVLRRVRPCCFGTTSSPGLICADCPWWKACEGCPIDPDRPLGAQKVSNGTCIAVEWDAQLLQWAYDPKAGAERIVDGSVNASITERSRHVPLETCLDEFRKEEELEEPGTCPSCSKFALDAPSASGEVAGPTTMTALRPMLNLLEVWRLPPFLIIQLKRFQHTQFSRMKLNDFVDFPLENLDLAPFLAKSKSAPPVPSQCGMAIWQALGGKLANDGSAANLDEEGPEDTVDSDDSTGGERSAAARRRDAGTVRAGAAMSSSLLGDADPGRHSRFEMLRNRRRSSVGPEEAFVDGVPLLLSRSQATYDLYAVTSHAGVMGAGHYIAYARSSTEENSWYCFNDRVVTKADPSEVVGPAAYLLFYVRKDISEGWLASVKQEASEVRVQNNSHTHGQASRPFSGMPVASAAATGGRPLDVWDIWPPLNPQAVGATATAAVTTNGTGAGTSTDVAAKLMKQLWTMGSNSDDVDSEKAAKDKVTLTNVSSAGDPPQGTSGSVPGLATISSAVDKCTIQ
jgi:ubiquitin C-terminal hydrolase